MPPEEMKFTVNGAIPPDIAGMHFFLPPDVTALVKRIEDGTTFMLHGPRGAGKTTAALHALRPVERKHGWYRLVVDVSALTKHKSEADFWTGIGEDLQRQAKKYGINMQPINSAATFRSALGYGSLGEGRKVVLMLDEFDTVEKAVPVIKEEVSTRQGCC